ncbi:MAG: aminoglycoside 3'-phosphotransferase [Clostridia bacterium]|nr:aminoglycoside 3'-phosphotransferase [Clostridia bacterium]
MKKTLIAGVPYGIPEEFKGLLSGGTVYDSSCSPEARVYFIDKQDGFYLKIADGGSLSREYEMTKYFHSRGIGTEALGLLTVDGRDMLLTRRMRGEDLTHPTYLSEPKRLCDLLATRLRELHEMTTVGCPVTDRVGEYLARAESNFNTGCYDKSHFPDSFGYRSAEEAWSVLSRGGRLLKNEVLIHGDYCLPNIMLDEWDFVGFIDVDGAGIGDRHIDLFWGAWTLSFNLGTDEYRERFFDAYGRDKIDEDALSVVAAAEVFG